jgi:hypothetical protein
LPLIKTYLAHHYPHIVIITGKVTANTCVVNFRNLSNANVALKATVYLTSIAKN